MNSNSPTLRILLFVSLLATTAMADELDRAIAGEMQREGVPALTFAVVKNSEIVRLGAYGIGNIEWNARATNETRFEVASVSKMIAGAAIRIAIEDGEVATDDPVTKYIDGLPPSWSGMKVRHLITMSTGLPEDFGSDAIPYNAEVCTPSDDASLIKEFISLKPVAPIGDRFSYSSANYAMLGMIVTKVTNKSYAQFVQERIFDPAGMTQSSVIDNSAVVPQRAEGYRRAKGELQRGWFLGQYLHSRPDDAILTTSRDLAKFVIAVERNMITKDVQQIWSFPRSDTGHYLDYAYGWNNSTWLSHRRFDHSGSYRTGFHTFVARFPDDELSIVVLTNCDFSPVRDIVNMIARIYIKDVPDPALESNRTDPDPQTTEHLISVMTEIVKGKLDPAQIFPDALDPIGLEEVSKFLAHASSFRYAGRARVRFARHGHDLVDYETLRTELDGRPIFLTLYRDASGKVACIELSN